MFTKKPISIIFSVLLIAAISSGNASAHSFNSAPGLVGSSLTNQNFTAPGVTTDCSLVTEIPQSECEALVALYNSTNGASWTNNTNWLQTNTPCSWYAVNCVSGYVGELLLGFDQLSGSIPSQLGNLTQLTNLSLHYNQLSGSIPAELGNLTQLTNLSLGGNQLSGSIPPELGNLTQLTNLNLGFNQLSGSIPAELGNLTLLTKLSLGDNQLSGSIPPQLGNLSQLEYFFLDSNQLSGNIPPELGNLTNLGTLWLQSNQLSGNIPPELGNMRNLSYLVLFNNQLSGSVPSELGNLTQLIQLGLSSNQLSGSLPVSFENLTYLQYFEFADTNLCEPSDAPFQSWLNSIPSMQGTHVCTVTISGSLGAGGANATLTYTGGSTSANSSGHYIITVPYGWSGIITPSLTGTTFSPVDYDYSTTPVTADLTGQNFTATLNTYTISGSLGAGGANATLAYTGGSTSANSSGHYTITVPYNWSGAVKPSKARFVFTPASRTYSKVAANQINQDYAATNCASVPQLCPLLISGSAGDAGVVLHFYINGLAKTVTSASNGRYAITVPYDWSGTVTPNKSGITFNPLCRTYSSILTTDQLNQNYVDIVSFISSASYDGWILESAKGTSKGGSLNSTATTFKLGDDNLNRQYRAILSFNTVSLPDTVVIQSAVLKIKPSGSPVGTNPFSILSTLYADIRTGYFGISPALELADFNATATANEIGSFGATPVSGWYSATLNVTGRNDVNKTNLTQLRLYFALPTNNNNKADYMLFFSGNATAGSQPQLIITYSLP